MTTLNAALEQLVRRRANAACEYCRIRQEVETAPLQIDHIIAQKHGGLTDSENLAIACLACNLFKGPNIAGIDPDSGALCRLFHPRNDDWHEHFRWNGALLQLFLPPIPERLYPLPVFLAVRYVDDDFDQLPGRH